jgi:hypothetical protein
MLILDPLYFVFALPALLLGLYAQYKVHAAYDRYQQVPNAQGLSDVNLEGTPGELSDHYDPRTKTLRLSPGVAHSRSVAALGIVAHEVGHALQDAQGYMPLRLRAGLVPLVNLGSWLGPILFIIGLFLSPFLAWIGVLLFAGAALFALVTLPVEFDASRRALRLLQENFLVDRRELSGVRAVLSAAALTYVAALVQSLSTLAYYIFLLTGLQQQEE